MNAETSASTAVAADHPMKLAWDKFCATDEFKNALDWATRLKYDDGRDIAGVQREEHAKGSMWLAFTKGMSEPVVLLPNFPGNKPNGSTKFSFFHQAADGLFAMTTDGSIYRYDSDAEAMMPVPVKDGAE